MKDKNLYYRKNSNRLVNWDYVWNGYYFITICTYDNYPYFGYVLNGEMFLNDMGKIAHAFWEEIPVHFNNAKLENFVVMPNHVHGVVVIDNGNDINLMDPMNAMNAMNVGARHGAPLRSLRSSVSSCLYHKRKFGPLQKNSISSIINHYKGSVTKKIKNIPYENFKWQSRYYDRIIHNNREFNNIQNYIKNNPAKWWRDRNN